MAVKYTNNAKSTLASGINSSVTSATVADGSIFPALGAGEYFYITFDDGSNNEIAKVTARSGNTLTIVRAQDNTTARAFSTGDSAELRIIAAVLTEIQENIAAKSANQTVYSATAASNATAYNIGVDPGVEANASVFLDGVYQHHDTFSFSGSTLTFDAAPTNGTKIEVVVDNLVNLQSSNLTVDTFTATSGQTAFTLSDAPGGESNVLAFIDGVFQNQASFTLSSNTLTFDTGVVVGRSVTIYTINPVNIGTPSDNTVTSAKLSGNITLPGSLTVGAYDVAFDSPTFVVDNSNGYVGIGTASPSSVLDVVGGVKMSSTLTVLDDVAINNGSPELYFGTTGNHYNWRIAAQELLDAALTIDVGSQDTNYANDTYTQVLSVKNDGSTIFINTIHLNAAAPVIKINDTNATDATTQTGYLSFQRQAVERSWIGYGSSSNDHFSINNTEGAVRLLHSGSEKLATISSGVQVTGLVVDSNAILSAGVLTLKNASGDSNGLKLYQDTSDVAAIVNHYTGHLHLGTANAYRVTIHKDGQVSFLGGGSGGSYTLPNVDQTTGYDNASFGAAGFLYRNAADAYITSNTYYYKTGGGASWKAKFGSTNGAALITLHGQKIVFHQHYADVNANDNVTFSNDVLGLEDGVLSLPWVARANHPHADRTNSYANNKLFVSAGAQYYGVAVFENSSVAGSATDSNHGTIAITNSAAQSANNNMKVMYVAKNADGTMHTVGSSGMLSKGADYRADFVVATRHASGGYSNKMKIHDDGYMELTESGGQNYAAMNHMSMRNRREKIAAYEFNCTTNTTSTRYHHFKTGYNTQGQGHCMVVFHAEGYNYGNANILDVKWGFHISSGTNNIYSATGGNAYETGGTYGGMYLSSDNYVVLVLTTTNTYYMSGRFHVYESNIYGDVRQFRGHAVNNGTSTAGTNLIAAVTFDSTSSTGVY